jgi:LPS sulfotransferase NodH
MATHSWPGYFSAQFDSREFSAPKHRYAIFSSQRTGSNYLCARLNNVKNSLGIPMEYLHPDAIHFLGARLFPDSVGPIKLERYLDAVARVRTTRDGWFGAKIQPNQLLPLFDGDFNSAARFLGSFDRLIFITRRDKLRQAISGAIAYATGTWFNFGDEPNFEAIDFARLFPNIDRLHSQYVDEERLIGEISSQLADHPLLHITYEDISLNPQETFERCAAFLGLEDVAQAEEEITAIPTQKPPGTLAERIRTAYLRHLGEKQDFA